MRNKLFLMMLGSSLEYYDFVLYGLLATYIGKIFFPVSNSTVQLIQSFSIFALGYLIRPISGTILGFIADRYSKIKVFSFSILLMGVSTLLIGMLPSYDHIGILAPFLLALARLTQGISFAAELPGAVTILSGSSFFKKYLSTSTGIGYLMASTSFGFILASAVVYLLHFFLSESQVLNWGWRLPFIMGGILAFISYVIRRSLEKTEEFKNHPPYKTRSTLTFFSNVFIRNYSPILKGVAITSVLAQGTIFFISLPHLLQDNLLFSAKDIHFFLLIGLITFTIFSSIFGNLIERINLRLFFSFVAITFPILIYFSLFQLKFVGGCLSLFILFFLYEIYMSALYVSGLRILSQLFLSSFKNTSISFCYNLSFSLFSLFPILVNYLTPIVKMIEDISLLFIIPSVIAATSVFLTKERNLKLA